MTVLITDVEPSQVPESVLRSTATDGGTVTVVYPPPQALPAPPAFTAYQGYSTGSLNLAGFTVPGGPDTAPGDLQRHDRLGRRQPPRYGRRRHLRDDDHRQRQAYLCNLRHLPADGRARRQFGRLGHGHGCHERSSGSHRRAGPRAFTVFQNDATGSLTLANFSIPAALPGAGSASYTATIDWGDGGPATAGTVQLTGLTVTVSGSYTYARGGKFQPTVVLQDNTGGGSATVTDAVTVLADVTSQVHPVSSGPIYNPLTRLFNGSVTFTNTSATPLTGPFPLVFQGLPAGVTLANATGSTGGGIPYISDPLATLPPGQSSTVAVQFSDPHSCRLRTPCKSSIRCRPSILVQLVSTIDPSLISASAVGGVDPSQLSMSADGRYVAFAARPSNRTSFGQTNPNALRTSIRPRYQTGTTTLVSMNSSGTGYGTAHLKSGDQPERTLCRFLQQCRRSGKREHDGGRTKSPLFCAISRPERLPRSV